MPLLRVPLARKMQLPNRSRSFQGSQADKEDIMRRYGQKSHDTVEDAMHRMKKGTLRSSSGEKVTNPKQAIAIGLSEARQKGGKVPDETDSFSGPDSGNRSSRRSKKRK